MDKFNIRITFYLDSKKEPFTILSIYKILWTFAVTLSQNKYVKVEAATAAGAEVQLVNSTGVTQGGLNNFYLSPVRLTFWENSP